MGMVYPQKSREQAIEEVRKKKPHLTEGELQAAADKALARLEQRRKNKRLRSERAKSQRPAEKQDDLDETFDCLDDLDCRDAGGSMISIVEMLEIALSHDVSDTPRPCDGNSDDSYGSPRSYGSFLSGLSEDVPRLDNEALDPALGLPESMRGSVTPPGQLPFSKDRLRFPLSLF